MRIYFLSCVPAILKLNGEFAGGVDLFERYVDLDLKDSILAEIVPGDNLQPVNFFIDGKLLSEPPDFMDAYLGEDEAIIHIRRFGARDARLNVILQTRFEGNLVTVFSQGEVYLAVEGKSFSLTPIGSQFLHARAEEKRLAGYSVLALCGGDGLIIISHAGEQIFAGDVIFAEFGERLKTCVRFETAACAQAHCEYSYDGGKLTLVSSKTVEKQQITEHVLHFAFFESVMTYGDFEKYLSPELAPRAGDIREYLGKFSGVVVPTEKFRTAHPGELAAGLVYPERANLYKIKYFAVLLADGKIDNIYPVDN